MAKKRAKYSSRQLTDHLRELAAEAETIVASGEDEGRVVTKGEALARLLWRKALGYSETDPKTAETKVHQPEAWAMQLIWDRMEGRAPQAITDEKAGLTAADKVHDLAKLRLNSAAQTAAAVPGHSAPVDRPSDGPSDSEGPGSESDLAG